MEKVTEQSVEDGKLPPESGWLVKDLDHATPDLSVDASKRPRDEEEDDVSKQQAEFEGSSVKRSKIEDVEATDTLPSERTGQEDDQEGDKGSNGSLSEQEEKEENNTASNSALTAAMSPLLTRSRAKSEEAQDASADQEDMISTPLNDETKVSGGTNQDTEMKSRGLEPNERWRVHKMTEDYVDFVGKMMYPGTQLRPYGFDSDKREYPIEGISVLGYLKSPLRRPTIIEKWSPYEISLFEAALLHHGKEFHTVSKEIRTKSTKEVVDFYYVWKKTAHYKKWKEQFVPDVDLLDIDSPAKGPKI